MISGSASARAGKGVSARPSGSLSQQPKKKLVIKTLKSVPKLPDNFEDVTWEKLREAVVAVHQKKPVAYNREELYRAVEEMCIHKMSASLYSRLEEVCTQHVSLVFEGLTAASPDQESFLEMIDRVWQDHCEHMLTIRSIFLYLDRTYVLQTANVKSLWDMGLQLLRRNILAKSEIEHKLVHGILALIERERRGEAINRLLVRNLIRMLVSLQLYHEKFEGPFIAGTEIFYQAEGEKYMDQSNVREFLIHVENRLQQASDRVTQYLDPSTRKPLITCVEQHLLRPHTSIVVEKGFDGLMDGDAQEDLKRMYYLFSRVDALEELKAAWNVYIRRKGLEIINDQENEKDMVDNLLKFKARLDKILEQSFDLNEKYTYALKEGFEYFINARQNRPAELIAKFIDMKLRAGQKGTSDDELEGLLDKVMVLFRYIQGKDVFEAFYKKDLAKRLLLGKSASFDAEKSMISKLKTECGNSFTNKLEGMFKDIDLSRDIMTSFEQHAPSRAQLEQLGNNIDMSVQVLTTGYWPPYPALEINLPSEMAQYQEVFRKFYLSKYSGRQLIWQHSLGQCVVKTAFPKGRKELQVSLYQTLVLLCFNNADVLDFKYIKETTGLEDKELRRTLQSLACGKIRVLQKIPRGKDVEDGDRFEFNKDFSNKLMRIKINQIQIKETVEENEETHERVFRDRQYQVDAAIVRTMKARKTLTHNMLMSELFSQLKFPAKPADLKKRIESLIEREYLERDEDNPQVYNYLA